MVEVLTGPNRGRYPHGNAVLVTGRRERVLIDPTLAIAEGTIEVEQVDRVLISHCHEDHLAGVFRFPTASIHVHAADRVGLESLDGLMKIYGMPPDIDAAWRSEVLERFHYLPRPDAKPFTDGDEFDLGGTAIRVVHLPGHTRGHTGFLIEPDAVMFLADIDLTGFGPYYGDAWSSLDDTERSIRRCRDIDANTFVTFHHKGTVTSRSELLAMLDHYAAVIEQRERAMLAFLVEPRTIEDMVAHRFIYRPHVTLLFADAVERRSAALHLQRLLAQGLVSETAPGRFVISPTL
jgi:glyoxylase-like metal-dependent hydrolase (beta-lactamase superfamily II)